MILIDPSSYASHASRFNVVVRRLPIIRDILKTCKSHLQPIQNPLSTDDCDALEKTMDGCHEKPQFNLVHENLLPHDVEMLLKRRSSQNDVEDEEASEDEDGAQEEAELY
ncbi:uncharacterized protein Z519_05151 [Cladophialophora bantiana CBS 173.52]|uniref:Uncharacterized protein n=1 Tax=Cladophialophora bantiana (strain ATCC 10958 / CBS 173.52 / CDC B-1940 / NIH 8579) TaxID=1442370 RepID=A0A0D2EVH3_CLAB1|nr:uncharacterized protein Z519_05151 [Cladophialophora bantiana CBS 173.52]KIW93836.1 hypothetical protein Z519_05151 [Cladophialophora bantiana CBS 173.52]